MKKPIRASARNPAKRAARRRAKRAAKKTVKKAARKAVRKAVKKTAKKASAEKPKRAPRAKLAPPPSSEPPPKGPPVDAAHYKRMLVGVGALGAGESVGGFESLELAGPVTPDLSGGAIDERVEATRAELHRIVKDYLGDRPELYDMADEIAASAKPALVAMRDSESIADEDVLGGLEVIVRSDGSRPSFMVRGGEPDTATSPIGTWGETLTDSAPALHDAIACIGRIDDPSAAQGFHGTGILVQKDLVMTNRHVLQGIAAQGQDGSWTLKPNIAIDFGHEFRATDSMRRRAIRSVVFAGVKSINPFMIEHAKLDLALLELGPGEGPEGLLAVDLAPDWGERDTG